MGYANTGQLIYSRFEQGLQLFVEWWNSAVSATAAAGGAGRGGSPCWELRHIRLPVIDQVVCYCELERVVTAKCSDTAAGVDSLASAAWEHSAIASTDAAAAAAQAAANSNATSAADAAVAVLQRDATAETPAGLGPAALAAGRDAATVSRDAAVAAVDDFVPVPAAAEEDVATAAVTATHAPYHIHQYSIVWHEMYQVPVLYIRAFSPDGGCLSVDDLMIDLPGLRDSREPDQADWTFLTAVEHPLTHSPCYMLHPCQTAERMRLMIQPNSSSTTTDTAVVTAALCSAAAAGHSSECSSCIDSMGLQKGGGAAAREAGIAGSDVVAPAADAVAVADEDLLLYMRGWFSLVAGVLGFSMVRHGFW